MDRLPPTVIRLVWSHLAAQMAEQLALAATPLLAVFLLKANGVQTSLLQTAQTLPFLLLSIPAGLLIDRFSRRKMMIRAEWLRLITLLFTLWLTLSGLLNMLALAGLSFVGAIGTLCYSLAAPSLVPALVARQQLSQVNRWLEVARSAAYVAGPAIGGALAGWAGFPTIYALAIMLSLAAIGLIAYLPADQLQPSLHKNLFKELRDGARFVGRHALLQPIIVTAILFNTAWFMLQAIFALYAVQHLHLTAAQVGKTLGIYGAGMITGAWVAPWLAKKLPLGVIIGLGPLGGACAALLLLATLWLPYGLLAGLAFYLFGIGPILWTITTTTLRQAVTPPAMLGRVSSFIMTAAFGSRPFGALLSTLTISQMGINACLALSTMVFSLQFGFVLFSPLPRLQQLPSILVPDK